MLMEGVPFRQIRAAAAVDKQNIALTTLSLHRRHIRDLSVAPEEDAPAKGSNIEILEEIIQKGFQNRKNWKPTISDTMKALDMHFRLTQGNPFDELLDTLAAASLGEDEAPEANPDAVSEIDEQEDIVDPEGG